ncbi:MAG: hypothetical protein QF832_22750 [SAR324 cluster bacterium]|nr:hypothetical protein [SAR324 cluster bacterium]
MTRSSILGLGDASRRLHRRHPLRQRSDIPQGTSLFQKLHMSVME